MGKLAVKLQILRAESVSEQGILAFVGYDVHSRPLRFLTFRHVQGGPSGRGKPFVDFKLGVAF